MLFPSALRRKPWEFTTRFARGTEGTEGFLFYPIGRYQWEPPSLGETVLAIALILKKLSYCAISGQKPGLFIENRYLPVQNLNYNSVFSVPRAKRVVNRPLLNDMGWTRTTQAPK